MDLFRTKKAKRPFDYLFMLTKVSKIVLAIASLTLVGELSPLKAQIVPDNTLGKERSRITTKNQLQEITGGSRRGNNLFHSFEKFSIPPGKGAYFIPQGKIANIFTRVTGRNLSQIQGILGVKGNANLYLLNPNGIIFGKNARLDLRGSFFATTAESFLFPNGKEFSASNPQTAPILTVNVVAPIGLKFGNQPTQIINQSQTTNINNIVVGLQVGEGKSLTLVGGDLFLEGGTLTAFSGTIELASIAPNQIVNLNFARVAAQGVNLFQDISLAQSAKISSQGQKNSGNISLTARNISVTEGSIIATDTANTNNAGDLNINATESVAITGGIFNDSGVFIPSRVSASVLNNAQGNGGIVTVDTKNLVVADGAIISAATNGFGKAGNLNIKAAESIEVKGGVVNQNGVFESSRLTAGLLSTVGKQGGNIQIETKNFLVSQGARVLTWTFGPGNSGNLTIKATEAIRVDGGSFDNSGFVSTGLIADVNLGADGDGGNLQIETKKLIVSNGARISSLTKGNGNAGDLLITATDSIDITGGFFGNNNNPSPSYLVSEIEDNALGNGGNVYINTGALRLLNGGAISTSNYGFGKPGNINIIADSVELSGRALDRHNQSIITNQKILASGLFNVVGPNNTEKGAAITVVATNNITLKDSASIDVDHQGKGQAGDIFLSTKDLSLNNQTSIYARSSQGDGGNTQINLTGILSLRRESNISSAVYGDPQGGGQGGNITINGASFVLTQPYENSNILGNNFGGTGGVVQISTNNIFGFLVRSNFQNSPELSEIASSTKVIINGLEVTPKINPGIINAGVVEISFARLCESRAKGQTLEFYDFGRGGTIPGPEEYFSPETLANPWLDTPNLGAETPTLDFNQKLSYYLPCQ